MQISGCSVRRSEASRLITGRATGADRLPCGRDQRHRSPDLLWAAWIGPDLLPSQGMSTKGRLLPTQPLKGPAELVLAAVVARRYYLDGRSKSDIADELRLSRFKIGRLLDTARDQGLVKIEISNPGAVDVGLSAQLQDSFGLHHAVVVTAHDDHEPSLRKQLGQAAAELLTEIATPSDVLGLAWARSVRAMVDELRQLPAIPVVQLTGAIYQSADGSGWVDDDSSIDVVREIARLAGGPAYFFFAPFLVPDAATAQALRRQEDVARALTMIESVTKAVIGVGRWAPGQSTLFDAATDSERQSMLEQGVCAEVGGVFLASDGVPLPTPLNDRMVSISASQMRTIPEVIGIAYGASKQIAVRAALASGLVNSLVTHTSIATALLTHEQTGERSQAT